MDVQKIHIYTNASSNVPRKRGDMGQPDIVYTYILFNNDIYQRDKLKGKKVFVGGVKHSTINRIKLLAIVKALQSIKFNENKIYEIIIYTNLKCLIDNFTRLANCTDYSEELIALKNVNAPDLWESILPIIKAYDVKLAKFTKGSEKLDIEHYQEILPDSNWQENIIDYEIDEEYEKYIAQKNTQSEVVIQQKEEEQILLFILVETDYLAPNEQETLVKIVESVGLTFAQTQKITIDKFKPQSIDYPHYFISFSLQRPPFIINEKYQVVKRENKTLLWANTLEVLTNDKAKKVQLWKCLKEIFLP